MEIHKEIYNGCKEVLGQVGEESLRAAFLLAATLVERCKKSGGSLGSRSEVRDILPLYGIYAVGILHIGEIHYAEAATIWQMSVA